MSLKDSLLWVSKRNCWNTNTVMAPSKLPCLVGGKCNFQTVQLDYNQAKPCPGFMATCSMPTAPYGGRPEAREVPQTRD